jgi:hypothetical protein
LWHNGDRHRSCQPWKRSLEGEADGRPCWHKPTGGTSAVETLIVALTGPAVAEVR